MKSINWHNLWMLLNSKMYNIGFDTIVFNFQKGKSSQNGENKFFKCLKQIKKYENAHTWRLDL